ncbi:MAG: DUF1669 domain-containing protein [Candidatus Sericytochromatia bacterium]|nr:DUF1669 domain-containing protein [Candidatus Tanganyikabacteria bacterium]
MLRPRLPAALRRVLLGLAAGMLVPACGAQAPAPLGARLANSEADPFGAQNSGAAIEAFFNKTYGETIAANEPAARDSAINTDKGLLALIRSARKSLDGAFYDINDPGVVAAMIEAARRGVAVRLVTDTDNMAEKDDPTRPRQAILDLQAAGVAVRDDRRSAIMHHKFLIVDRKAVWMGSTNLTTSSLYHHNNNALILRSGGIADQYGKEFSRLFEQGSFGPLTGMFDGLVRPTFKMGGASVQVYFSPKGGGKAAVADELRRSRKSIRFLTFSLTDREVGDILVAKRRAGVEVTGVFDRWLAAGPYSLFLPFKAEVQSVYKDGNEALMHHKVFIIDGTTVITGSFNYSQNAESANNESFVIARRSRGLADAFEEEFQRVLNAALVNKPPAAKPRDSEQEVPEVPKI